MPLMALKKICGSCFKHGCSTISWGMLLELRNCSWNFGVVLTIAGLLKSTGLLYKKRKNRNQYIYTSGSWSFNLSNSELAEAWFVQSIQWTLRLRRTSIWVIMSTHQNSLHDQSTQLKEWWLGLEQEKEKVDSVTVLEKTSTWDASVSEGVWGMYLFASTHI